MWQSTKAGSGSKHWVLTCKPGIIVRCADLKYTAAKLVKIGADAYLDIACRCLTCQESLLQIGDKLHIRPREIEYGC